ncbi:hypothetical protein [Dickeya chrysanthemi]|uniref:hypothetical protein n=1 Tax=Dickeya chrysanthemi TaxID=556 RepID=UPI000532B94B|nr:hypothetical protein [Dickeya chrysanthemi]
MVAKTKKLPVSAPERGEHQAVNNGMVGVAARTFTTEEIDAMTPRGKKITASRAEIHAMLLNAARNVKFQSSPIIEAAGGMSKSAK